MANEHIHETVSKFARGVRRLLVVGGLALLASCGGDAALQADQAVQTFNKQVIKLDTERHSLLSSLYSTAKMKGGVTPSGKVVINAELLAQNPAVLKMVGAEKTLAKPQRVQAQTLVSSSFSPVFRIQNGDLPGSYFFTIYESERVAALAANPNWSYEGPAFYTSQTEEGGLSPVWRFRNLINGSYVFTIYESERQSIVNDYSSTFAYEGVSWYARQTEALGFTPLYRFRNVTNGTYLFSAYESEKVAILQNYASTFVYEGVAYYVQVPGGASATPPPMQVTNQSAVLKPSVISGIDASLTKVDQIGNFTSAAGRTWVKDQVFMYQGRAYKVMGVIVNADGTTSLSTVQPRLDTIYDDLKFTLRAHALAYDANAQPIASPQSFTTTNTGHSLPTNAQGFAAESVLIKPQEGGLSCIVPKATLEGPLTTSGTEWGYAYEIDCTLNDLLKLGVGVGNNLRVHGDFKSTAEIEYTYDKNAEINYTTTSQSIEANLNLQGNISASERLILKASKDKCKENDGVLECEMPLYEGVPHTGFIGAVPFTIKVSAGVKLTVDINGQLGYKYMTTTVSTKGYKAGGIAVDETTSTGLDSRHNFELQANFEADLFIFGGLDLGVGTELAGYDGYFAKIEVKAGPYMTAKTSTEQPLCVQYEGGLRANGVFYFLKFVDWYFAKFEGEVNSKYGSGAIPANCDAKGKALVGYSIAGKKLGHYVQNLDASTDILDVYDAGKDIFDPNADGGKLRIALSSSGLKGKPIQYEVTMLSPATTSTASIYRPDPSPAESNFYRDKAFIDPGNSTYGSVIRFKISAYDPNNRLETETVRRVEIRIEPAMSASPKYQHYVSTNGAEGYLANYWYGSSGALLTSSQIKNGYLEVAAGDKFVFASEYNNILNNLDTGKDIAINTAEDRTNLRPKRLALLSKLDKASSEQFFNFVELTDVVINSVNILPAEPTVGNLATFTVTGDRMPANLAVNIPNCSTPVEVRSAGNIAKNNYATGIRVFTCTPNASGEVVTATFGPNNFAKTFRIPPQTCPAGQTVVNGVCVTTPVGGGLIGKSLTIDYRYPDINTYLTGRSADPITVTVGNGVELPSFMTNPTFELDISANKIRISNYRYTGSPATITTSAASFNGLVFTLPVSSGLQFASASLGSGTAAVSGIASSDISINSNQLRLNIENSQYSSSSVIEIDFTLQTPQVNVLIDLPATSYLRGLNVALSTNGYGGDALMNAPPYADVPNAAEWDFYVPASGSFELFATYATAQSRPSQIAFNGVQAFGNALAANTGGYYPFNRQTLSQGIVQLSAGATTMRVSRSSAFPHIQGFTLVPVTAGSLSVPANLQAGTAFTVPTGVTSCTFTASGSWASGPVVVDATGTPYTGYAWVMPSGQPLSLIGLRAGTPFYIGNSSTLSVTSGESLYLLMNDANGYFGDNSGALSVSYSCN